MPKTVVTAPAAGSTRLPKIKCCVSKPRCSRCPLQMLADGTLPAGHTVIKRRLIDPMGKPVKKKAQQKAAKRLKVMLKEQRRKLPKKSTKKQTRTLAA